jgi:flagellar motor switch protein FliN/FliY
MARKKKRNENGKSERRTETTPFSPPEAPRDESAERQGKNGKGTLGEGKDLSAIKDVKVRISVVLGSADIRVADLLTLGRGAVIELDSRIGSPIDVYANDRLVARGEVVVIEDRLGVTLTEIVRGE